MGMTPDEFWSMSPYLFFRKREGYLQAANRDIYFYRQNYALTYNLNRSEKMPYLDPYDVMPLHGEKKKRKPREPKSTVWTDEEIQKASKKHSSPPSWQEP